MNKRQRIIMRNKLHVLQGGKCCYCGRSIYLEFDRGSQVATIEHLKRRCDGGTDHPDNLALACHGCNSQRGTRSWVEFATAKGKAA